MDIVKEVRRVSGECFEVGTHDSFVLLGAATEIETLRAILKGVVGSHVEYSGSGQAWSYPACLSGFDAHGQFMLTDEQDAALQRACWPEWS